MWVRIFVLSLFFACACQQTLIDRTDRSVYGVISDRQKAALGTTTDANIGPENGKLLRGEDMYSFTPHPVDSDIPEEFQTASQRDAANKPVSEPEGDSQPAAQPVVVSGAEAESTTKQSPLISPTIFTTEQEVERQIFLLSDALEYALCHAREFQGAKEDLYLAALDLTLERHLWTPQFVGSVQAEYANYGQVRDFDRAMSAVSDLSLRQRLPFGGDITARVINNLMRDLEKHITSGEPGNVILEANIPLFRGAGRVAYESRYTAEREVIYAVRTFENFRRGFAVRVAASYLDLQQTKASIGNAYKSYRGRYADWEKADFVNRVGRSQTIFDASRARSSFRNAESSLVSAKEQHASSLDRFKVLIGMPVATLLDVVDQDHDAESSAFDRLATNVEDSIAEQVALKYRLDLLTLADQVDDAKRGVVVAKNRILPDLNLSGSATLDTDPEHLSSVSYNTERTTWRGMAEMRIDDRKTERNAYRASLISLRRAERAHDLATDNVRVDVRRALRRIEQQRNLVSIQAANVEENVLRLAASQAQFDLGKIGNRDVVDADTDLLAARNQFAAAVARYRNAILEFHRDAGSLRIDDQGRWYGFGASTDRSTTEP